MSREIDELAKAVHHSKESSPPPRSSPDEKILRIVLIVVPFILVPLLTVVLWFSWKPWNDRRAGEQRAALLDQLHHCEQSDPEWVTVECRETLEQLEDMDRRGLSADDRKAFDAFLPLLQRLPNRLEQARREAVSRPQPEPRRQAKSKKPNVSAVSASRDSSKEGKRFVAMAALAGHFGLLLFAAVAFLIGAAWYTVGQVLRAFRDLVVNSYILTHGIDVPPGSRSDRDDGWAPGYRMLRFAARLLRFLGGLEMCLCVLFAIGCLFAILADVFVLIFA